MQRLQQQLELIIELDRLKTILRRTRVKSANNRFENTAEHSWHVALMAILLQEHANEAVDIAKVVKMLLIHDVVEIDAGDTFVYDEVASQNQADNEVKAAKRLFGYLPQDQADELLALWLEFEAMQTAEAKFAKSLDRIIPMLLNYHNDGQSWQEHGVAKSQVLNIAKRIEPGSDILWQKAQQIVSEAVAKGWLKNQ